MMKVISTKWRKKCQKQSAIFWLSSHFDYNVLRVEISQCLKIEHLLEKIIQQAKEHFGIHWKTLFDIFFIMYKKNQQNMALSHKSNQNTEG